MRVKLEAWRIERSGLRGAIVRVCMCGVRILSDIAFNLFDCSLEHGREHLFSTTMTVAAGGSSSSSDSNKIGRKHYVT